MCRRAARRRCRARRGSGCRGREAVALPRCPGCSDSRPGRDRRRRNPCAIAPPSRRAHDDQEPGGKPDPHRQADMRPMVLRVSSFGNETSVLGPVVPVRPFRSAQRAAWVRSVTPIVRKTLVRCALTVFSLIESRRAMSLLLSPSASRSSTSRSRSERAVAPCAVVVRALRRARAALGSSGTSPAAAARTARASSSGSASLSR